MASFAATRTGMRALAEAVEGAGFESVQLDTLVHPAAAQTLSSPAGEEDWLWNLDRIDQGGGVLDATYVRDDVNNGTGVLVYVVDSGIDKSAATLNSAGKVRDLYTADTAASPSYADMNGHGTHVAATIGSSLYGVAGGVTLVNGES